MDQLSVYLPQDRRAALARGEPPPEHTHGAALFADISGFTPLTEALDRALGPRRGAEALTHQLYQIYDALIAEVERLGGSVIGFAGDSITCWFDESVVRSPLPVAPTDRANVPNHGPRTALRAVACALALQQAMQQFAAIALPDGATTPLALKIAIASGSARRFLVGDPSIQLLASLAGATVSRMAAGEHLARQGEILIDAQTTAALGVQPAHADLESDRPAQRAPAGHVEGGQRDRAALPACLAAWRLPAAGRAGWMAMLILVTLAASIASLNSQT